jgi:ESCRT-I complex subunit TSG101
MPYLHDWSAENCDLVELALFMSSIFGSEPPCYAKPKQKQQQSTPPRVVSIHNSTPPPQYVAAVTSSNTHTSLPPPPPPASATSSSNNFGYSSILSSLTETVSSTAAAGIAKLKEEKQRRDIEREVNEANIAAAVARAAAMEEQRSAAILAAAEKDAIAQQQAMERSRQDMITIANTKIRNAMMTIFDATRKELYIELQNQKLLECGRIRIEELVKNGEEYKSCLIEENNKLNKSIVELELWLKAVEDERQRQLQQNDSNNNNVDMNVTDKSSKAAAGVVDLMALPADTYSAQMLALTAESAAIDDCIYFLDTALVRGRIPLDVYLKEVRRLSKRQFLAKVRYIFD